jgi:hypothetical protein
MQQTVAGAADDVSFRKAQEREERPVRPENLLLNVENHDHVLNGVQDLTPVAGDRAVCHPIFPSLESDSISPIGQPGGFLYESVRSVPCRIVSREPSPETNPESPYQIGKSCNPKNFSDKISGVALVANF